MLPLVDTEGQYAGLLQVTRRASLLDVRRLLLTFRYSSVLGDHHLLVASLLLRVNIRRHIHAQGLVDVDIARVVQDTVGGRLRLAGQRGRFLPVGRTRVLLTNRVLCALLCRRVVDSMCRTLLLTCRQHPLFVLLLRRLLVLELLHLEINRFGRAVEKTAILLGRVILAKAVLC